MNEENLGKRERVIRKLKTLLGLFVQYIPGLTQQTGSERGSREEDSPSSAEIARNLGCGLIHFYQGYSELDQIFGYLEILPSQDYDTIYIPQEYSYKYLEFKRDVDFEINKKTEGVKAIEGLMVQYPNNEKLHLVCNIVIDGLQSDMQKLEQILITRNKTNGYTYLQEIEEDLDNGYLDRLTQEQLRTLLLVIEDKIKQDCYPQFVDEKREEAIRQAERRILDIKDLVEVKLGKLKI